MSTRPSLIIIGAGGHARVTAETVEKQGSYSLIGFFDDARPKGELIYKKYPVLGPVDTCAEYIQGVTHFFIALGDNAKRKHFYDVFRSSLTPAVIIHPSATVSDTAYIGGGTIVCAGSVINALCHIGENCIINAMSLIDHESHIGDHVHIAQGTIIGSNVTIPDLYTTDLGAHICSRTDLR